MSEAPKTQAQLLEMRREAEQELMRRYPGVVGVALGLKVRGGRLTDETSFRIYVHEKKRPSELQPGEMIPKHYKQVPTDVIVVPRSVSDVDTTPCADRAQHSTLIGGISISNLKPLPDGKVEIGTLGFFATFAGTKPPYNIGLVTNNHVFAKAGGQEGDTVYQPKWAPQPDGVPGLVRDHSDVIGTILRMPPQADDAAGNAIDAALVKLNICISSWCHTNCGVSFANEIRGLNLNGSDAIIDVGTVNVPDPVFKVGRNTGRTVGRVSGVGVPVILTNGTVTHNNIEIHAVSMQTTNNCGGALRFSDAGDSGSALIDSHGNLVGLVHGHDPAQPNVSHACHIQPVLAALGGVVPITRTNPVHGNPAAVGMRADVPVLIDGRPNQTPILRAKFLGCDEGRRFAALAEQHRHEIVHLVNNNRRVMVAWHRNHGPAFLNRAMNSARDPEQLMPPDIEGITREALLDNMGRALAQHGSDALRAAIERSREEVLGYAARFDSLHDLVDHLCERQAA